MPRVPGEQKAGHNPGVETRTGELLDGLNGEFRGRRSLVRAVGRDRVKRIGDPDDPRHERNLLPLQAIGITASVPGLVVPADTWQVIPERRNRLDDIRPDHRVQLHLLELLGGQDAVLFEHSILDPDFADIVQHCADPDLLLHILGQTEVAGDRTAVAGDPFAVEVVEYLSVVLPFLQYGQPAQTRLGPYIESVLTSDNQDDIGFKGE